MCDHVEFLRYPLDDAVRVLGRKWATPVLMELLNGTDRFNTLRDAVPDISPRTLSSRLDDLERVGVVKRELTKRNPSRVHYALTEKGEDMRRLLRELTGFSLKWYAFGQNELVQKGP